MKFALNGAPSEFRPLSHGPSGAIGKRGRKSCWARCGMRTLLESWIAHFTRSRSRGFDARFRFSTTLTNGKRSVQSRRVKLGMRYRENRKRRPWTPEEDALLGT